MILVLSVSMLGPGDAQPSRTDVKYSGPIVIRKGGVYRGNWESQNPNTPAVTVATNQPVVIEYSNIRSRGPLIYSAFHKVNLTVRHTRGEALNPNRPLKEYRFAGRFLHLEEFESAVIENNELIGTSGMYFRDYRGSAKKGQTVKILRNKARNIDGRYSIGKEQFSKTRWRLVQFVQFNAVRNIANAEIAWNEVINEPGRSRPEENINMYLSSGVPSSAIKIHNNYIQGAYAPNPAHGEYSGGGINVADGSSKTANGAASYIRAYRNHVVSTSNVGIAVSAGHNIWVYENRIIGSGELPDGSPIASANVGLYVWDMHGDRKHKTFYNIYVRDNVVGWWNPKLKRQNPFWFPHCPTENGASTCVGNTMIEGRITRAMEQQEYALWQRKLGQAGVAVGIQSGAVAVSDRR